MPTNPIKKCLTYSIRDFYKDYGKACRKNKKYPKRDYIKYRDYIMDVFAEIFHKVLHESWHFVLPYSLGEFYIKEMKGVRGRRIYSKIASIRSGKATFVFNNHTLRRLYKLVWDRSYCRFSNAKYYKFVLLSGRDKSHRRYKVGREAIARHLFEIGSNPLLKLPTTYNKAVRFLQEPNYEQ